MVAQALGFPDDRQGVLDQSRTGRGVATVGLVRLELMEARINGLGR